MESILTEVIVGLLGAGIGSLAIYLIDNKLDKPWVREMVYEITKRARDNIPEGKTKSFLSQFKAKFKEEMGRPPTAGELKTASDIEEGCAEDS